MLPLYYDMQALCYVPENFERFDLTPEDVSTFDKYFDKYYKTMLQLNEIKGDLKYLTDIIPY